MSFTCWCCFGQAHGADPDPVAGGSRGGLEHPADQQGHLLQAHLPALHRRVRGRLPRRALPARHALDMGVPYGVSARGLPIQICSAKNKNIDNN